MAQSTLYATAGRQLGLITRPQLRKGGMSDSQVDRLIRSGRLVRVRRGVFLSEGAPWLPGAEVLAAILAVGLAGTRAWAAGPTAADQWGLLGAVAPPRPVLVVPRGSHPRIGGVQIRDSVLLHAADLRHAGPIPITSPARTICDEALRLGRRLGDCVDDADRRRLATYAQLRATYERLHRAAPHRPGLRAVAEVLAARSLLKSAGGSRPELDVWRILTEAGYPAPVQQHEVVINGRRYILDWAYPQWMIALEYDTWDFHQRTRRDFARDREKIAALGVAGWLYLPITSSTSRRKLLSRVGEAIALRSAASSA